MKGEKTMRGLYPRNITSTRRARTKEAIKGGIMLGAFCLVIIGLYFVSDTGRNTLDPRSVECVNTGQGVKCTIH